MGLEQTFKVTEYPAALVETAILGKIIAVKITGTQKQIDATVPLYVKEYPPEIFGTQVFGDAYYLGDPDETWGMEPKDIWELILFRTI